MPRNKALPGTTLGPADIHWGADRTRRRMRMRHEALASGITSPSQIAGLAWWYDFSDISSLWKDTSRTDPVTTTGDVIAGVTDKSGAGLHLSNATANGPAYTTNAQNGLSSARNTLAAPGMSVAITGDTTRTMFFAVKFISDTGPTFQQVVNMNSVRVMVYSGNIDPNTLSFSHIPGDNAFPGNIDYKTPAIYVVRDNSSTSTDLYTSGQAPVNGDTHPNWQSNTTPVWMESAGADFYEIICYSNALTAADINLVSAYLATKWGLTWTPVA